MCMYIYMYLFILFRTRWAGLSALYGLAWHGVARYAVRCSPVLAGS